MKFITRGTATKHGLKRYFTGSPCKNGHICERYTNTSHCVECDRIERKNYRLINREKIRESNKRYRLENKALLLAANKKYREQKKLENRQTTTVMITTSPKLAKVIPAPDWSRIGSSVETIQDRARLYKEQYTNAKSKIA